MPEATEEVQKKSTSYERYSPNSEAPGKSKYESRPFGNLTIHRAFSAGTQVCFTCGAIVEVTGPVTLSNYVNVRFQPICERCGQEGDQEIFDLYQKLKKGGK